MDVKKIILKHLNKKKKVKVADIIAETNFSRAYIHRFFKELRNEGKIILLGRTNKVYYILAADKKSFPCKPLFFKRTLANKNLSEDIALTELKREVAVFDKLRKNVADILDYAFMEMLNNAIEHSKSKKILIRAETTEKIVKFAVIDWGVGIFNDIKVKFKLKNILEAIGHLLKGKQTTAPKTHTGEGVFFTSKAADQLVIESSGKKLIFNNKINDVFVRNIKKIKGTKVNFEIAITSQRKLSAIFKEYTSQNFVFNKTKIIIKLFELGSRSYISRSQARRLLFGLEKFQEVILDFKKVETAGQAFADEVFRVWQRKHPKIKIESINCNENIRFMIKRALQL